MFQNLLHLLNYYSTFLLITYWIRQLLESVQNLCLAHEFCILLISKIRCIECFQVTFISVTQFHVIMMLNYDALMTTKILVCNLSQVFMYAIEIYFSMPIKIKHTEKKIIITWRKRSAKVFQMLNWIILHVK